MAPTGEPAASADAAGVPVVLCVYNRPDKTRAALAALRAAGPRHLLIVADGPKDGADRARCAAVIAALRAGIDWPARVEWTVAPANLGPRRRVTTGLSWAFARVESAIVLEDDCVAHPSFFPFCAELLARHRDDPRVAIISGSNFQFGDAGGGPESYYFSRYPLIWGWAGWRRSWAAVDPDLATWPARRDTPWLRDRLDGDALAARYWGLIFDRMRDGLDAWDYALLYACWANDMLAIHPARNLVRNIGFGPDATNGRDPDAIFGRVPAEAMAFPLVHPARVVRDAARDARIATLAFGLSPRAQLARLRAARAQPGGPGAAPARWTPRLPPGLS